MPSPVGHALGGLIVGLLDRRPTSSARTFWTLAGMAVAANAPDIDFLWGRHRAETHSIVVAVAVGLLVFAIKGQRLAILVTMAWLSHVLLDWLGKDTTSPNGVMAFWPFTNAYYLAGTGWFEEISRRYWLPGFWSHNILAASKEIVLLGPIVGVLAWWRFRKVRGRST